MSSKYYAENGGLKVNSDTTYGVGSDAYYETAKALPNFKILDFATIYELGTNAISFTLFKEQEQKEISVQSEQPPRCVLKPPFSP